MYKALMYRVITFCILLCVLALVFLLLTGFNKTYYRKGTPYALTMAWFTFSGNVVHMQVQCIRFITRTMYMCIRYVTIRILTVVVNFLYMQIKCVPCVRMLYGITYRTCMQCIHMSWV